MRSNSRSLKESFAKRRTLLASLGICAAFLVVGLAPVRAQKGAKKTEEHGSPELALEIRHQLQALPYYSVFDYVGFTLDGGRVTLSGAVLRPTLKRDAEAAVKSLEGVVIVVNRIDVLPVSVKDDELRSAVYRAIYEDPVLARYATIAIPPIHIIIKNGNVSLEGVVESAADKSAAGKRAGSAADGQGFQNDLVVTSKRAP